MRGAVAAVLEEVAVRAPCEPVTLRTFRAFLALGGGGDVVAGGSANALEAHADPGRGGQGLKHPALPLDWSCMPRQHPRRFDNQTGNRPLKWVNSNSKETLVLP